MKLFRECTTEEILELLGIETEVVLPKLKEEKVTLEDLEQGVMNYLYKKICKNQVLTEIDIDLIKLLLGNH